MPRVSSLPLRCAPYSGCQSDVASTDTRSKCQGIYGRLYLLHSGDGLPLC